MPDWKSEQPPEIAVLLLIADDDRDGAQTLAELLRLLLPPPVEIVLAFDGEEALASATGSRIPHAVIMDIEMPAMDGVNAAIGIRRKLNGGAPTLIAVTGHMAMITLPRVRNAFDHALVKPVKLDELLALLHPLALAARRQAP